MRNFDKALRILEEARPIGKTGINPLDAVEALTQAGLITPDLPQPQVLDDGIYDWEDNNVWVEEDSDYIYTFRRLNRMLTVGDAEAYGLAIIAAAKHVRERSQNNND